MSTYTVSEFTTVAAVEAEISKQEKGLRKAPAARKVNYERRIASLREHLESLQEAERQVVETAEKVVEAESKRRGRPRAFRPEYYDLIDKLSQAGRGRPNRQTVSRLLREVFGIVVDESKSTRELELQLREVKDAKIKEYKVPVKA